MSGAELLAETQRVADPRLVQQQELLAKHKEQLLKSSGTLEKNVAEHAEKQRKLNHMEKDVKRHKEKQKIEEEVSLPRFGVCTVLSPYISLGNLC